MQDPVSAVTLAVADPFIKEHGMTTPEDTVATPGVQNSATSRRPLVADLLERVQAILLRPGSAWTDIAAENHSIAHIYKSYLIFLAAIPAIATAIGWQRRKQG